MSAGVPSIWAYAYLIMSTALLVVWLLLYGVRRDLRRTMLRVSFATALLGLTEPLFVPKYWNPYTLFDLARRTGFDVESLLFSFAIGGIVFAAYEVVFRVSPSESMAGERHEPRHRHHLLALTTPYVVFVITAVVTKLNPIYSSALALVAGFLATLYCRRDLWLKMIISGGLFLGVYFIVFVPFQSRVSWLRSRCMESACHFGCAAGWRASGRVDVCLHIRSVLVERVRAFDVEARAGAFASRHADARCGASVTEGIMKEIKAYIRRCCVNKLVTALEEAGAPGITIVDIHPVGYGYGPNCFEEHFVDAYKRYGYLRIVKVEVVCADHDLDRLIAVIQRECRTGAKGDRMIFVADVVQAIRIRDGGFGDSVLHSSRVALAEGR